MTETTDNILKRLLDSYPCNICVKHKKYRNEIRSVLINSGGYKSSYAEEMIVRMNHKFIEHIERTHLPSKEEWKIINKS